MELRPILNNEGKLRILIDSESILKLINNGHKNTIKLLEYNNSDIFDFIRTPYETDFAELREIVEFEKKYEGQKLSYIEIDRDNSSEQIGILYPKENIISLGQSIYRKQYLNKNEMEITELIIIQVNLNSRHNLGLLVTNNPVILEKRYWFESNIPGGLLNILKIEEAIEIMSLYTKHKGQYCIASRYYANKGLWYWYYFRSKIPYYHVGDPILDSFSTRLTFSLMSLDEMGFQYYSDISYDSLKTTMYHFFYLISLLSGIFDSFAIRTFQQYKLKFKGMEHRSRISLNKKAGKTFLKAIKNKNSALHSHIERYNTFIKLIYILRELILHREGLERFEKTRIGHKPYLEKIYYLKISKDIKKYIDELGDKKKNNEPISDWGVCKQNDTFLLDPFNFSKLAIKNIIHFSNEYLKLLGFTNFIDELRGKKKYDDFVKDIDIFRDHYLGF